MARPGPQMGTRRSPILPLRILSWNVNGLSKNTTSTEAKLAEIFKQRADVVALQETHNLEEDYVLPRFEHHGYYLAAHCPRLCTSNARGGTAIWVARHLCATEIKVPTLLGAEVAAVCISAFSTDSPVSTLALASWYIAPPRSDTVNPEIPPLDSYILSLQRIGISMILGDPNARHKAWCPSGSNANTDAKGRGKLIHSTTMSSQWAVENDGRPTMATSNTAPDVILACRPVEASVTTLSACPSNDHLPILIRTSLAGLRHQNIRSRVVSIRWEKVSWPSVNVSLERNSTRLDHTNSTNSAWALLYSATKKAIKDLPTSSRLLLAQNLPSDIESARQEVVNANQKARHTPGTDTKEAARLSQEKYITLYNTWWQSQQARKAHALARAQRDEVWSKSLWNYAARQTASPPPRLTDPSGLPLGTKAMASAFAREWQRKHSKADQGAWPPPQAPPLTDHELHSWLADNEVSIGELTLAVGELNANQCPDTICLKPCFFSNLSPVMLARIARVYSLMLSRGWCPIEMKVSDGIPVPKPGKDPSNVVSYRPVAITLLYSRVLEVIITLRTQRQIALVTTLHPRQFGFRRGLSTSLPVMTLIEQITAEMNHTMDPSSHRHSRGVVFAVDFTDAFCRVSPQSIDRQLEKWKVPMYVRAWIASFLTGRQLRVFAAGTRSRRVATPVGCPQGSILGPFLWLVVMEPLLERLDNQLLACIGSTYSRFGHPISKIEKGQKIYTGPPGSFTKSPKRHSGGFVAYADDLTVWLTDHDSRRLLTNSQALIEVVCSWASEEGIQISTKTEAMLCTPLQSQCPAPTPCPLPFIGVNQGDNWEHLPSSMKTPSGQVIPFVENLKFLGIRLDNHMRANPHAEALISTLTRETMALKQSCHFLTPPLRAIILGSRIGSKVKYLLNSWWKITNNIQQLRLEWLWALVAKSITGATLTTATAAVLPEARMHPLSVEAELMALKTAPTIWRLGAEYSFLKMFEGSTILDIPDKVLNPGLRKQRARIRASQALPRYLKEHNWLCAQTNNASAIDQAVRATATEGTPLGLQCAATNLLADLNAQFIFRTVMETKWLITLDPLASISDRKLRSRAARAAQLKKELAQFSRNRLTDIPDDYSDPSDNSDEEIDTAPRQVTGNIALKAGHNAGQLKAIEICHLQIYTDASVSEIADPEEVRALQSSNNHAAIRRLPKRAASGGAFIMVRNQVSVAEVKCSLGPLACSYSMERETILLALKYLLEHSHELLPSPPQGDFHEVALVTDSLSTLSALESNGPFRQADGHNEQIWCTMVHLLQKGIRLTMTFVYSHLGVEWNEKADELASKALNINIQGHQWPQDVIRPHIEEVINRSETSEGSLRSQYKIKGLSDLRQLEFARLSSTNWKRLMQLRTDACPLLGGHLAKTEEPCKVCGQVNALARGGKAVNHLFTCPGAEAIRATFTQYQKYKAFQQADREQTSATYISQKQQRERDRCDFTPKLLWSNPKVALAYFEKYLAARDEIERAPSA